MKCPQCDGSNFRWAKRCEHCGRDFGSDQAPGDKADRGRRILTSTGPDIRLTSATLAQIDLLRVCWRCGLPEWPGTTGKYALICRRPDHDVMAVKFQQVDVSLAQARLVGLQNRVLIALAMKGYLAHGHRGLIMPCPYTRRKDGDRAETGIAYLVGPHPDFESVSKEIADKRWDAAMGPGATAMVADFAREVGRVHDQAPRGPSLAGVSVGRPYFLTHELRPVTALGIVDSRVAVLGEEVLVTKPDPTSTIDGGWDCLYRAGFESLPHAPLTPAELRADGSLHAL
jgi:hypothetical protein